MCEIFKSLRQSRIVSISSNPANPDALSHKLFRKSYPKRQAFTYHAEQLNLQNPNKKTVLLGVA